MFEKIFFFIFLFFSLIIFSSEINNLKVVEDWDDFEISSDETNLDCPKCIPYNVKVINNGTICISIPRVYNSSDIDINKNDIIMTFLSLRTDVADDHYWVPWPFERYVYAHKDFKEFPLKIYSVMGFEIDANYNYYLLDQGIILHENNTVVENTSKLVVFTKFGAEVNTYYFNETDFTTSLLTDIVVDESQEYAYITDSGNLLNNQSIPRLIVLNLKNKEYYKILNNNENFKPEEDINITYSDNEIYNYFTNITGLNKIQISCDGEKIYFSSLKSKKIFNVAIKDIKTAINSYEKNKENINILNEIKLNFRERPIISNSFYLTSKKNILLTNGENGSIRISYKLDDDHLNNFNFNDFSEFKAEKFIINWPSSIDIVKNKVYILDNGYFNRSHNNDSNVTFLLDGGDISNDTDNDTIPNETVGKFVIYSTELIDNEYSYKKGCTIYIFKINFISIFLWSLFVIILIIVIFLMIISREKSKKKKNENDEDDENNENVNELNRRLNENENVKKVDEDEDE